MKKRIILVGTAASGKDYFKDYLISHGKNPSVSHTTRPMRDGEVNGETYHFVSDEKFKSMIDDDEFFEHKEFNGWKYGTSRESIFESEVFIFTPGGIEGLNEKFLRDSVIVYFDIAQDVRIERLMKRSDADSIQRRIKADEYDFCGFDKFDLRVTSPNFSCAVLKTIVETISLLESQNAKKED